MLVKEQLFTSDISVKMSLQIDQDFTEFNSALFYGHAVNNYGQIFMAHCLLYLGDSTANVV